MDYIYVVPSYNRVAIFKKKTLAFLKRHNVSSDKINVFVANEEQKALYESSDYTTIVGVLGLVPVRNYICNYYPAGQRIVSFDDDVDDLVELNSNDRLQPLANLDSFVQEGFKNCIEKKANLWGAYPTPNAFFMNRKVTTDLKFIIGSFFCFINTAVIPVIPFGTGEKEDYQRCLAYWERDFVIIRYNNVAVKTNTYKTSGGLQEGDRMVREQQTVAKILERWPNLVRINTRRKSKYPELLFKRISVKNETKISL
jgi:hypothetical protein